MASSGLNEPLSKPLTLYRFLAPDPKQYCLSNSNIKLETIFRMTKLPYGLATGNPFVAPKGKLPYIELPNGARMGDSTLIYKYLVATNQIDDLDADLSPIEQLHADSFRIFIKEWCHWLRLWDLWMTNYYEARSYIFSAGGVTSYPVQVLLGLYTYRTQKNNFYIQGFGRHTDDEIKSLIAQAVQMMATFVKEEDRLADTDRPCLVQATFFGFLMSMYRVKTVSTVWIPEMAKYPELETWTRKMATKYFPERAFP